MTYTKVSLPKKTGGSPGAPVAKNPNIIIILVRDLLKDANGNITGWPERDASGVKLTGNISLTTIPTAAKAIGIYATPSTIKRNDTSEGDADAEGFLHNVSFSSPGSSLAKDEFVQNNISEDVIIITRDFENASGTRVHGTPASPLKMVVEEQDDNEANKSTFTFKSALRTKYKSAHYSGTMPTLAADANYDAESGSTGSGSDASGI